MCVGVNLCISMDAICVFFFSTSRFCFAGSVLRYAPAVGQVCGARLPEEPHRHRRGRLWEVRGGQQRPGTYIYIYIYICVCVCV